MKRLRGKTIVALHLPKAKCPHYLSGEEGLKEILERYNAAGVDVFWFDPHPREHTARERAWYGYYIIHSRERFRRGAQKPVVRSPKPQPQPQPLPLPTSAPASTSEPQSLPTSASRWVNDAILHPKPPTPLRQPISEPQHPIQHSAHQPQPHPQPPPAPAPTPERTTAPESPLRRLPYFAVPVAVCIFITVTLPPPLMPLGALITAGAAALLYDIWGPFFPKDDE